MLVLWRRSPGILILTPKLGTQALASGQWRKQIIWSQGDFLVFIKVSFGGSSCLGFHSFWHLLCPEYLSHSAMFVDWMNDVTFIYKHLLYFCVNLTLGQPFLVVTQSTHSGDYYALQWIFQRPLFLMVWMLTHRLRSWLCITSKSKRASWGASLISKQLPSPEALRQLAWEPPLHEFMWPQPFLFSGV